LPSFVYIFRCYDAVPAAFQGGFERGADVFFVVYDQYPWHGNVIALKSRVRSLN
jgi:hypothetical protein